MAARLMVSTDELRTLGTTLSSNANTQISELQRIAGQADPAGIWDGTASEQYKATFDTLKTSLNTAMESLRSLGEFLPRAADAYDTTNDEVMQALGLG